MYDLHLESKTIVFDSKWFLLKNFWLILTYKGESSCKYVWASEGVLISVCVCDYEDMSVNDQIMCSMKVHRHRLTFNPRKN